jgi:hypothetical protein
MLDQRAGRVKCSLNSNACGRAIPAGANLDIDLFLCHGRPFVKEKAL